MSGEAFLDSNVLLYASSNAIADASKRELVERLIVKQPFALSAQVLQEYIANALRKPSLGITEANIDAVLELASKVRVQPITHEIVVSAVILRRRYRLSQWDATIIAAAVALRCGTIYSEDMGDGQIYDGVRVVNPFKEGSGRV